MKNFIPAVVLIFAVYHAPAQEPNTQRLSRVSLGFHQVKESANIGLVFKGPTIRYGMQWEKSLPNGIVRSLLVFRNGKLEAESYTKDDNDRHTLRAIWSCTKQVVGLLTGIAVDRQIIRNVNDSMGDYLPETSSYPDKKNIRIEHLLTMKSGISYSNDDLPGQTDDILRQLRDHVTDFILARPLANAPGDVAQYKDCDPQLEVLQFCSYAVLLQILQSKNQNFPI